MTRYLIDDNMACWTEERLNEMLASVSVQRREKALSFRFFSGRQQSVMAYNLLQKLLKEVYGITEPPVFRELENGKPVIIGHEDIHFNMSHCKNGVACAISDKPIGIDIECFPETVKDGLAEYVFNEKELSMLQEADSPTLMFTRLWTMKEAIVKLSGRGLTGKEQLQPLLNPYHEGNSPWMFETITNEDHKYVCTIVQDKE